MAKSTTTPLVIAFPCPQYIHTTKLLKRARVAKPKASKTRFAFGLGFIAFKKVFSFLACGVHGHFKQRSEGAHQTLDGAGLRLWAEKLVTTAFLRRGVVFISC